jgi:predicted dehydrogenase|tara:strand:- start:521 stop:1510 length:990 start_codon:yes stop_codon:yes gene_type:complete
MFNVGIIGYGKIGKIRHKILSKIKYVNIISICEENLDKKNYDNIFFTNKASEVINNKLIDTIFISVPNYLNKKFTIDSLKKNKNVFCEKPPALNSLEMKEIIKVEKKSQGKLMYGFNHRVHKSVFCMKTLIDSKKFGKILWMRGRYGKSVNNDFFKSWRSKKKYAGGGILMDQGIHMLDLFLYLSGSFDIVKSSISNQYWKSEVEDNAFVILENSKTKVSASLHSTMTQWRHLFSLEIFLQNGYLVLNGLKTSSNSYGKEILTIVKNRSVAPSATWNKEIEKKYQTDNSFYEEIKYFLRAIKNDSPIESSNSKDALKIMELIDKIYKNT